MSHPPPEVLHKRIFRPSVEAAGLPDRLRVHDLRHTCASLLIDLGAHPKVIQEWLGHKSITVTIDVYGHLFPSLNDAMAERLDEVFRQAGTEPDTVSGQVTPIRKDGSRAAGRRRR